MKEVLERTIGLVPAYVSDLLRLVQRPKSFVSGRVSGVAPSVTDALIFLAVSFLLGWIIKLSFVRSDLLTELATDAVFVLLQVLAYGAALCLAWRIVRGRAELEKLFVIHFYYSGVLLLVMGCMFMASMGALRATDAGLYADLMKATLQGNLVSFLLANERRITDSPALLPMYSVFFGGILLAAAWLFAGWGAYRELNHLSKVRSALAAALYVLFWVPIVGLTFLIANAGVR